MTALTGVEASKISLEGLVSSTRDQRGLALTADSKASDAYTTALTYTNDVDSLEQLLEEA